MERCKEKGKMNMKKRTMIAVIAGTAIMCVCAACGNKTVVNTDTTDKTQDTQQIANPWVEYDDVEKAAKAAGFEMIVPEHVDGYTDKTISVMDNRLIQVEFSNGDSEYICFRKCAISDGESDISGDFNEYSFTEKTEINKNLVTMKGDAGKVKVAVWSDGTYNYSIGSTELLTEDNMTELVAQLK